MSASGFTHRADYTSDVARDGDENVIAFRCPIQQTLHDELEDIWLKAAAVGTLNTS
jgi:hypothetical protein